MNKESKNIEISSDSAVKDENIELNTIENDLKTDKENIETDDVTAKLYSEVDNIDQILAKRAQELSEEADDSKEDDDSINIVEFLLNDEIYAIDADYIKQVVKLKGLTTIPCTPNYVLGVTSIQEQIISVIDLRHFFQMAKAEESKLDKMVVLERKDASFAVAADEVIGIKKVYTKSIQKTIDTFDDIRKKYFYGLTDDQTIILDGGKILADQDIIVK